MEDNHPGYLGEQASSLLFANGQDAHRPR